MMTESLKILTPRQDKVIFFKGVQNKVLQFASFLPCWIKGKHFIINKSVEILKKTFQKEDFINDLIIDF